MRGKGTVFCIPNHECSTEAYSNAQRDGPYCTVRLSSCSFAWAVQTVQHKIHAECRIILILRRRIFHDARRKRTTTSVRIFHRGITFLRRKSVILVEHATSNKQSPRVTIPWQLIVPNEGHAPASETTSCNFSEHFSEIPGRADPLFLSRIVVGLRQTWTVFELFLKSTSLHVQKSDAHWSAPVSTEQMRASCFTNNTIVHFRIRSPLLQTLAFRKRRTVETFLWRQ